MSTQRMNAEREGETKVEVKDPDQKESKEGDKREGETNKNICDEMESMFRGERRLRGALWQIGISATSPSEKEEL